MRLATHVFAPARFVLSMRAALLLFSELVFQIAEEVYKFIERRFLFRWHLGLYILLKLPC